MVIELDRNELRITEPTRKREGFALETRSWPRAAVGELRPNRYSKGLLVQIPGQENFDTLKECRPELIEWLGRMLAEGMERSKPIASE